MSSTTRAPYHKRNGMLQGELNFHTFLIRFDALYSSVIAFDLLILMKVVRKT